MVIQKGSFIPCYVNHNHTALGVLALGPSGMGWGPTLSRPQALPLAATSGWPDGVRQGCLGKKLRKKKALGLSKVAEVVCIEPALGWQE